ncbi:hypothetical protein [Saccharospirillum mangrovi]|uniref:hypothetical protein n=1 Tax=Saccharospirillum mangrovi TaxID=2161747 RepID=UPI000D373C73|nr:hypothetical protein [Saccharospirillum mangrovi]
MSKASGSNLNYSRLQLLIILLTPLLVMAAATGLYYSGWLVPVERVNKGVLLDPVLQLSDFGLEAADVNPEHQWLMIQTSARCNAQCLDRVHTQRQIHVSLGKDEPRMKRLLLTESQGLDALEHDFPGLTVVTQQRSQYSAELLSRIPANFAEQDFIFVVDPLGNIPLYFTPANDYKDQLADLETLLDLSTIG